MIYKAQYSEGGAGGEQFYQQPAPSGGGNQSVVNDIVRQFDVTEILQLFFKIAQEDFKVGAMFVVLVIIFGIIVLGFLWAIVAGIRAYRRSKTPATVHPQQVNGTTSLQNKILSDNLNLVANSIQTLQVQIGGLASEHVGVNDKMKALQEGQRNLDSCINRAMDQQKKSTADIFSMGKIAASITEKLLAIESQMKMIEEQLRVDRISDKNAIVKLSSDIAEIQSIISDPNTSIITPTER